ncbi:kinetochore-associated protein KNL-2 homolog isoform X2 [Andrographis paniculata]|uniref:kinetochore-associated protein KNL-2 homolog isoform X2 n=1 Tax=Andrographis paniculata TaxID=175694 RepID=UPI0021E8F0AA|nr:kinetochore-associated protein KNL-2 homolog isoform X2 [Andrographis paniculata]
MQSTNLRSGAAERFLKLGIGAASNPQHPPESESESGNVPKSHFKKTVCLADWWLTKVETGFQRRGLAVAGFSSREKQALRVFSSAPILKRYDIFTLETSDGICVILKGFINKAQTLENGFPSDCKHKKSSPDNISGVDLYNNLSFKSQGVNHFEDGCENFVGSKDGMNAKDVKKNKKPSVAAPYSEKPANVVSEGNLNMPSISCGITGQESLADAQYVPQGIKRRIELDADSVKNDLGHNFEAPTQHSKNMPKPKDRKSKKKSTVTRPLREGTYKQKVDADASILSESAGASGAKTKRREYKTPDVGHEQTGPASSSRLMSCTRSRSGRLLMPTLEFWRNERAIYSVDRTVTGFQKSMRSEELRKGSGSEPPRKRWNKSRS